ncbi:MAG: hypothetical protein N0A24_06845 [Armatimonadetes bacterium]|nr:hypothetical protein [Armatimonadota bacterium]MDW8153920.1 hypothetical protein [Armatimonadota bacterium]
MLEMPFTVKDFQDLLKLLRERPEWREELRRVLLTDELLELPRVVRELGEEAVARLAEAQLRTEERVSRLEEAVARLEDAQARTELALQQLAQQVGRLSDAVGFTLEELARELGPSYLAQRFGIRVESLERRFFTVDGEEVEVDFFGEGTRDGERIVVVGEVRSRIYGRDVEVLARRVRSLAPQLTGTPVPALFGFVIHPSAQQAADRTGVLLIAAVGK